ALEDVRGAEQTLALRSQPFGDAHRAPVVRAHRDFEPLELERIERPVAQERARGRHDTDTAEVATEPVAELSAGEAPVDAKVDVARTSALAVHHEAGSPSCCLSLEPPLDPALGVGERPGLRDVGELDD